MKLLFIRHNLLFKAWAERVLIYIYIVYTRNFIYVNELDKPNAWGYKWAALFLGGIGTGTWPSRLGKSQN
jgi:hypothetical protein